MSKFLIENTISGHSFGVYEARDAAHALDVLARDAGYDDYAEMNAVTPAKDGELAVTEVA